MQILITGGTGNISHVLVNQLLTRGHDVTVVSRGTNPLPEECRSILANRFDPADFSAKLVNERPDVVIDFLCFEPEQALSLYELFRGKTSQVFFISSATVYEKPHKVLPLTEDAPHGNIFSDYARKKIECEAYFQTVRGDNFPLTIVRPSHTFSERWIPSPLYGSADFTIARRIENGLPIVVHGDGQSLWTLTAASDFCEGLVGLIGNPAAIGEDFHITSDEALTWNSIHEEIGMALGHEPNIVHIPVDFLCDHEEGATDKLRGDKAEDGVFDNSKIKRFVPEFQCRKSFRTAIRESVAWYRADASRQHINPETNQKIDHIIEKWLAAKGEK